MRSTLVARLLDTEDRRKAKRHATTRKIAKLVRNCGDELCVLRNLSTHGAQADVSETYLVNDKVLLSLRMNEFVGARVAWVGHKSVGMEFYEPIARDAVLANLCDEEKRSGGPRVAIVTAAKLMVGTSRYDAVVGDLSQKGARILGDHNLAIGTLICLELDRIGSIPAEVRWSDAYRAGVSFQNPLALWDMMRFIKSSNDSPVTLSGA